MTADPLRIWRGSPRRPLVVFATAVAILAGPHVPQAEENASEQLQLNPLSALKRSDLKAFREKPLFTPSRQPPPAAPRRPDPVIVAAIPTEQDPPKLQLAGVIEGATAPVAILQRPNESAASTVRVGDHVDGWVVASINSLSILLRDGIRQREYRLFDPNATPIHDMEPAASRAAYRPNPKVDLGANIRRMMQQPERVDTGPSAPGPVTPGR